MVTSTARFTTLDELDRLLVALERIARGGLRLIIAQATLGERDAPMVIAVPGVRPVEVSVDEVVRMLPVGNCLVTAIRTVLMRTVVSAGRAGRRTDGRVRLTNRQRMLLHATGRRVLEVAVI